MPIPLFDLQNQSSSLHLAGNRVHRVCRWVNLPSVRVSDGAVLVFSVNGIAHSIKCVMMTPSFNPVMMICSHCCSSRPTNYSTNCGNVAAICSWHVNHPMLQHPPVSSKPVNVAVDFSIADGSLNDILKLCFLSAVLPTMSTLISPQCFPSVSHASGMTFCFLSISNSSSCS
jgi:hypothetical protein